MVEPLQLLIDQEDHEQLTSTHNATLVLGVLWTKVTDSVYIGVLEQTIKIATETSWLGGISLVHGNVESPIIWNATSSLEFKDLHHDVALLTPYVPWNAPERYHLETPNNIRVAILAIPVTVNAKWANQNGGIVVFTEGFWDSIILRVAKSNGIATAGLVNRSFPVEISLGKWKLPTNSPVD